MGDDLKVSRNPWQLVSEAEFRAELADLVAHDLEQRIADRQWFLDVIERGLEPELVQGTPIGFKDVERKELLGVLKTTDPDLPAREFIQLMETTLKRERDYLLSTKPNELNSEARRIHGTRIHHFLTEARAVAAAQFGHDPVQYSAALNALGSQFASLFVELHSSAKGKFTGVLDSLSPAQRLAWTSGVKLPESGGGGANVQLGFELRSIGGKDHTPVIDDLALLIDLVSGHKRA